MDSSRTSDCKEEDHAPPPPLPPRRPPLPPRRLDLPRPIAIPATNSQLGSPFLRAYPPELDNVGISRETFLEFLDHLNRVAVVSPPLVMVSLAAGVAGFVPEPTTQIVAFSVDMAAEITTYAMSKGRTEAMLRKGNREIFGPHGMKAQVAKLEAVAHLAGMPILDEEKKIIKGSTILAPHEDVHELHTISGQQRRLKALEPWISPLEIDELPEMERPDNPMSRMHVAVSEWQRKFGEDRIIKNRKKALDGLSERKQKASKRFDDDLNAIAKEEGKIREKKGDVSGEEMTKLEEKRLKAAEKYEDTITKIDGKHREGDKEEKGIRKIYFLLITNIDELDVVGETKWEEEQTPPSETEGSK